MEFIFHIKNFKYFLLYKAFISYIEGYKYYAGIFYVEILGTSYSKT